MYLRLATMLLYVVLSMMISELYLDSLRHGSIRN
jgi:hypothetical protein